MDWRWIRSALALGGTCILVAACTTLPGAPSASGPGLRSSSPRTSAPSATERGATRDIAPDGVVGRVWIGEIPGGRRVVGKVGEASRNELGRGSFPIASDTGDLFVATPRGDGTTRVERLDPISGEPVWRTTVEGDRYLGSAAARLLVLGGSVGRDVDPGLVGLEAATGAVIELMSPGQPPRTGSGWSRSALVTPGASVVVSSLCDLTGPCISHAVDVDTGDLVELDAATPALIATDEYALTWDGTVARGVSLATGKAVWERDDRPFDAGYVVRGNDIVASWRSPESGLQLELLDLESGASQIIAEAFETPDPHLWPELSTPAAAAIGEGGRLSDVVLADGQLDAATVDLQSGAVDSDAIRLAEVEP
jgi:hypothetical protein